MFNITEKFLENNVKRSNLSLSLSVWFKVLYIDKTLEFSLVITYIFMFKNIALYNTSLFSRPHILSAVNHLVVWSPIYFTFILLIFYFYFTFISLLFHFYFTFISLYYKTTPLSFTSPDQLSYNI